MNGDSDKGKVYETNLVDTSRWSKIYEMVFSYGDNWYLTSYSKGATENQDERPFEYDDDEIDCTQVHQVKKSFTVWEPVRNKFPQVHLNDKETIIVYIDTMKASTNILQQFTLSDLGDEAKSVSEVVSEISTFIEQTYKKLNNG